VKQTPESRASNELARSISKARHELRLYVAGTGPRSLRAMQNIRRICDTALPGAYHLEVVDLYKQPNRAAEDQVVAIPTLIKRAPGELRRLVGDLSQEMRVRHGLGLAAA
jgi:circadian clock protein KaiB